MSVKVLIVRFSSFGDVVQCMNTVNSILVKYPNAEIHWVCRKDVREVVSLHPSIKKVWSFDPKLGLMGLMKLGLNLRREKFDIFYDAHSNIRSRILSLIASPIFSKSNFTFIRRSKERIKRIMLFSFRKNHFDWPFKGAISFLRPLETLGVSSKIYPCSAYNFSEDVKCNFEREMQNFSKSGPIIALVPSAAWPMKRWPLEYWKDLVRELPNYRFIVLGGPSDVFCSDIENVDPSRVKNLAGKLSLLGSCYSIYKSDFVVSADTGLIHVADFFGKRGISLIGPTAFGYVSGTTISTLEVELDCRPCTKDGRGKCSQTVYQKCMIDITPNTVADKMRQIID